MFELSAASGFFVVFLLLGALLLRNGSKYRPYIFLTLNIVIYLCGCRSLYQALVAGTFVCLPFFAARLCESYRKWVIPLLLLIFIYLARYQIFTEVIKLPYFSALRILGLSYFLFREIDYLMQYDYLKEEGISLRVCDYLNYVLSFYCLLAGPILRYEEFVTDFYQVPGDMSLQELLGKINRIINGYVKVYVISAILGYWAGVWFEGLKSHSSVWAGLAAFFLFAYLNGWYIYFNFSGYCDIVIGFADLAGLSVHENFNKPYLAASVSEFWNRHHITLSEWIRDYIYSPMFKAFISGPFEKNIKWGQYLALFLTFTIAGIWHGTDANYLIYGLFQGLGISLATIWKDKRKKLLGKEKNKAYEKSLGVKTIGRIVTWSYICLTFSFVGYDVWGLIVGYFR